MTEKEKQNIENSVVNCVMAAPVTFTVNEEPFAIYPKTLGKTFLLNRLRVQLPDYATLCRCARNNPDGFGFAIPGKKPYKALDFEKFVDSINKVDEDLPMIIHFRKATHGSIKKANCHPFRDNDNGISFAHNGMLNGISTAHDKTDSETAFNLIFVPAIEKFGFGTAKFKQTIETIRGYSRFAFLTDNGTIKTYGQFIESNGCLYSNGGYLAY